MENHKHNHHNQKSNLPEYLKFIGVLLFILLVSAVIEKNTFLTFLDSFMGVFFTVFASFKLFSLKEFAYGFQSYDLLAKKSLTYSYLYPFIQLLFGALYLLNFGSAPLDAVVITISLVSGAGVLRALNSGAKVHCVCLGNVIKLPLSTISFIEDFGMAIMALAMLLTR